MTIIDEHKQPVPFARLDFTRVGDARHYTFITNTQGQAFVLTLKGVYTLTINSAGQAAPHQETLELSYGVIPRPLTWVMRSKN